MSVTDWLQGIIVGLCLAGLLVIVLWWRQKEYPLAYYVQALLTALAIGDKSLLSDYVRFEMYIVQLQALTGCTEGEARQRLIDQVRRAYAEDSYKGLGLTWDGICAEYLWALREGKS